MLSFVSGLPGARPPGLQAERQDLADTESGQSWPEAPLPAPEVAGQDLLHQRFRGLAQQASHSPSCEQAPRSPLPPPPLFKIQEVRGGSAQVVLGTLLAGKEVAGR